MIPRAGQIIRFGTFDVTTQVFHTTPHSFALVNLKPLLPGHVLVCPLQHHGHDHDTKKGQQAASAAPPSRLNDLTAVQTVDLFETVRRLTPTLARLYDASAFNIAIQDGKAAGQSVAHVHVHVIPRRTGDMDGRGGGDRLYEMMERGDAGDICARPRNRDGLDAVDGDNGDYCGGDDDGGGGGVGDEIEERGKGNQRGRGFSVPDAERKPRGQDEMRREAEWLRRELERDGISSTSLPPSASTSMSTHPQEDGVNTSPEAEGRQRQRQQLHSTIPSTENRSSGN